MLGNSKKRAMTKQFHEGQDVEVHVTPPGLNESHGAWRMAKIVSVDRHGYGYAQVQFPDGTRAVFDADHIRAAQSEEARPAMTPRPWIALQESLISERGRALIIASSILDNPDSDIVVLARQLTRAQEEIDQLKRDLKHLRIISP
jgi:hypothetical protein